MSEPLRVEVSNDPGDATLRPWLEEALGSRRPDAETRVERRSVVLAQLGVDYRRLLTQAEINQGVMFDLVQLIALLQEDVSGMRKTHDATLMVLAEHRRVLGKVLREVKR